jgi:hypothetical protein
MSVTMLEQPIKVAVAITHVDKYNTRYEWEILLSLSRSKYFCHCSHEVTILLHTAADTLGRKECVCHLTPNWEKKGCGVTYFSRQQMTPQLQCQYIVKKTCKALHLQMNFSIYTALGGTLTNLIYINFFNICFSNYWNNKHIPNSQHSQSVTVKLSNDWPN